MPVPTVITDLSTTASSNSPAGSDTPSMLDDIQRAHGAFIAQLAAGTGFTSSITVSGNLRAGSATQGQLGAREAGGTGQTASASFNNAVLDSSGNCGMTMLSGSASVGAVVFGDSGSATIGRFQYDHATDEASIWAAGAQRVAATSLGMSVTGKITSVLEGAGSGQTANTNNDNIVIDSDGSAGLSIMTGATSTGGVRFGRLANNAVGGVAYNHATDVITLVAGGVSVVSASGSAVDIPNATVTAGSFYAAGPAGFIWTSLGLGFTTGAGGTVTQATSKATAVTLDRNCGRITLNGAALAAGAVVSFTFTNNRITERSIINMSIRSGAATGGSYVVSSDNATAGSCRVTIRNLTAGSLSEALVLTFAVFDGSDS